MNTPFTLSGSAAKAFIVTFAAFFVGGAASAQSMSDCVTPDLDDPVTMGGGSCSDQLAYTPDKSHSYQNTPNLVFRLNYHFIRPTNGSGPFAGDMSSLVHSEVGGLNWFYNDIAPPTLPVSPPAEYIDDARVRFVLEGIYYHDDDAWYNIPTVHCSSTLLNAFGVDADEVINIFYYTSSYQGSYGCGPQSYVNMTNSFPSSAHGLLAHELGHVLGLPHTFTDCCFDDSYSDTYHPDCNTGWVSCGVNEVWGGTCQSGVGVGVSNNIMGYNSCRKYLSPMQMARIHHFNITTPHKRKYVKCTPDGFNPTMVISHNAVWESSKIINSDIEIEPGVTLDVRCTLYMSPHAKIIVKQGARLIIDGGTLTAHSGVCHDFWPGIEVWGTSNQHQSPASHPTHQGMVILKNGAVIEHAHEAIRLWKPGDWNSMGGVVQVQGPASGSTPNATFLNCRRAVEFMAYQNFVPSNPSIPLPNNSYFSNAWFKVDDDYRGSSGFYAHVSMWAVDGVYFTACTFENAQTTITESGDLGRGIISGDADYKVLGHCTQLLPPGTPCPEQDMHRGRFIGLGHGIQAFDGSHGRGFTANELLFENNVVGVYAEGLPGFMVSRNQFVLGNRDVTFTGPEEVDFQEAYHRAISTQLCQGFRIEENSIEAAQSVTALGIAGIVIENSGANSTQVYKNTASGLDIGYIGEGHCVDENDLFAVGHQFLCNTNEDNMQNFLVRMEDGQSGWSQTIRIHQGSDAAPAMNIFDQETGTMDASDYKNLSGLPNVIWHKGGTSQPLDFTSGWVGTSLATGTNSCPSLIGESSMVGHSPEELRVRLNMEKQAYEDAVQAYLGLLDGGDTEALLKEVRGSGPKDASVLRDRLLAKSPFLSTGVLVEVMRRNILPQSMVLELCLANPEATQREGFVHWASYEAPAPLPEHMVDRIAGSWREMTPRTEMEVRMAHHHAEMTLAADLLHSAFRMDTTASLAVEKLAVWRSLPNYGARWGELSLLLRSRDFDAARTLLNGFGVSYPMHYEREAERDRALWFVDLEEALYKGGRTVMQLDSGEVARLKAFAVGGVDLPGSWARSILCFGYAICLPPGGGQGGRVKSLNPAKPESGDADEVASLRLMPNPASSVVTISVDGSGSSVDGHVRVLDMLGREVFRVPVRTASQQLEWNIREQPVGTYQVELFGNGRRLATERLVIAPR